MGPFRRASKDVRSLKFSREAWYVRFGFTRQSGFWKVGMWFPGSLNCAVALRTLGFRIFGVEFGIQDLGSGFRI